ncbi:hypothetical protein AC249_AIPGENE11730 [Exaiptasia diaphana]|nr:hypothetical protein AC249_AIPGENE11730 [Exaiptasia diaphana]
MNRLQTHADFLRSLKEATPEQRARLCYNSNSNQQKALAEIIYNALCGNCNLSAKDINDLRPHQQRLKKLASPKASSDSTPKGRFAKSRRDLIKRLCTRVTPCINTMPSRKRKLTEMALVPADHVSTSQKILQEVEDLRSALTLGKPEGVLKQMSQIDAMFDKVQSNSELDEAVKEKILGSLLILKQNYAERAREHEGNPPDSKEDSPGNGEETEEEEEEEGEDSTTASHLDEHPTATKDVAEASTPLLASAQKYQEHCAKSQIFFSIQVLNTPSKF